MRGAFGHGNQENKAKVLPKLQKKVSIAEILAIGSKTHSPFYN